MHPRTQVTIQIIKRGIGTILVLACFLAASQMFNQRGKKQSVLGASQCSNILVLYITVA